MINTYTKFIKGKIIAKKDISKILTENKINAQIIGNKYYRFRRTYIIIIKNNKIFFLNLCLANI